MSLVAVSVASIWSGSYIGRASSRRSSSSISAPASFAPSSAVARAARLRETFPSEPPGPTIVSFVVMVTDRNVPR
jgi:hypothetical protein